MSAPTITTPELNPHIRTRISIIALEPGGKFRPTAGIPALVQVPDFVDRGYDLFRWVVVPGSSVQSRHFTDSGVLLADGVVVEGFGGVFGFDSGVLVSNGYVSGFVCSFFFGNRTVFL